VTGFLLDTNVLSEFKRRGIELLPSGKRRAEMEQWQADLEGSFAGRLLDVTKPGAGTARRDSIQFGASQGCFLW